LSEKIKKSRGQKRDRYLMQKAQHVWIFGFLAKLISLNWFYSVEIYYLSPDHSHTIVDRECFKIPGYNARSLYSYWIPDEFWNNFVVLAFHKTSKKLSTLEYVVVWN
jgi:hypothetical protein